MLQFFLEKLLGMVELYFELPSVVSIGTYDLELKLTIP